MKIVVTVIYENSTCSYRMFDRVSQMLDYIKSLYNNGQEDSLPNIPKKIEITHK
jgi:hypothetical protein